MCRWSFWTLIRGTALNAVFILEQNKADAVLREPVQKLHIPFQARFFVGCCYLLSTALSKTFDFQMCMDYLVYCWLGLFLLFGELVVSFLISKVGAYFLPSCKLSMCFDLSFLSILCTLYLSSLYCWSSLVVFVYGTFSTSCLKQMNLLHTSTAFFSAV